MNIEELRKFVPNATKTTWHQHTNGGGWVENSAVVAATAHVASTAQVYDTAQVYGDARVCGDAWDSSPLYIVGTRHTVGAASRTLLRIGCIFKPGAWWEANNVRCGEESGYSAEEIAEYSLYIDLFVARYGGKENDDPNPPKHSKHTDE